MAEVRLKKGLQGVRDAGVGAAGAALVASILCSMFPETAEGGGLDYATTFTACLLIGTGLSRAVLNWWKHRQAETKIDSIFKCVAPLLIPALLFTSGCAGLNIGRAQVNGAVAAVGPTTVTPGFVIAFGFSRITFAKVDAVEEQVTMIENDVHGGTIGADTGGTGPSIFETTIGYDLASEFTFGLFPVVVEEEDTPPEPE